MSENAHFQNRSSTSARVRPYWPDIAFLWRCIALIRYCLRLRRPPLFGPREIKSSDQRWRWQSFTPAEMVCRHCGECYHWPDFMDALQAARDRVGTPFIIVSGHRCSLHNARIGGAPRSEHLRLAADISLNGHDPGQLYRALRDAGFSGFGFYQTFIHADMGRKRQWFGSKQAKDQWNNWLD